MRTDWLKQLRNSSNYEDREFVLAYLIEMKKIVSENKWLDKENTLKNINKLIENYEKNSL